MAQQKHALLGFSEVPAPLIRIMGARRGKTGKAGLFPEHSLQAGLVGLLQRLGQPVQRQHFTHGFVIYGVKITTKKSRMRAVR